MTVKNYKPLIPYYQAQWMLCGKIGGTVVTPPFDPSTIAGLKGWWKADAGVEHSVGVPAVDGDTVFDWLDSSGGGFTLHAVFVNPVFKTNIINGKPVLRFAPNASMQVTTDPVSSNYTVFAVANAASTSAGSHDIMSFGTVSGPCVMLRRDADTLNQYHFTGTFSNVSEASGIVAGAWNYITINWDGANIRMWRNGTLKGTVAAASMTPTGTYLSVGWELAGTNFWDGDIAEVLIYNSALITTDRQNVEAYFRTKYGLP